MAFLSRMHRWIFALLTLVTSCALTAGPVPPALEQALKNFHAEGTKGWAFTQTTASGSKSMIEQFDPAKTEFHRWTLIQKDGRVPSADELKKYQDALFRRARTDTAPNVKDQIDSATCEFVDKNADRSRYRFRLKPGGSDDKSAAHMAATFTLHEPSGIIEQVELASVEAFSPVLLVKIAEARTVMTYSLPEGERPTLLQQITVRVRGRAMWFRSLDDDMTVSYSNYVFSGKKLPRADSSQP